MRIPLLLALALSSALSMSTHGAQKKASSAESVGELRLWKCPKIVIESDFQRRKSA
jgi:hypothetical protein